jgi:hypothetical protein
MVPSYKMLAGRIDEEKKNLEQKARQVVQLTGVINILAQHVLRQNRTAAPLYILTPSEIANFQTP